MKTDLKRKNPKASENFRNDPKGTASIRKCSQKTGASLQTQSPNMQSKNNLNMKTEKTCLHCGQTFEPTRSDAKFCTTSCRWNAWRERASAETKVKVHPAAIRLITDATWEVAHNMLWNNYPFSKAEVELCKLYIQEYYEEIPAEEFSEAVHNHFKAYCERVLLAKRYVSRFPHRYIPHPCLWLNKENPKGFAGTKSWYLRNLERRKKAHSCDSCGMNHNSILNHFHFCA